MKVAKELFADYVKEKKLREPEEKKELAQTLKTFYVEARKKGFVQRIIKQLLDSVFVISRIIRISVSGWQPLWRTIPAKIHFLTFKFII